MWDEDLHGIGNDQDNWIVGNRGDNRIEGGRGKDVLVDGEGNDTYVFFRGDGSDIICDADGTSGNDDVCEFEDIQQSELQFWKTGDDLLIQVRNSTDQKLVKDWYVGGQSGTDHQIERIKTSDGLTLYNTDVDRLVEVMSGFAPQFAGQTQWRRNAANEGQALLAAAH